MRGILAIGAALAAVLGSTASGAGHGSSTVPGAIEFEALRIVGLFSSRTVVSTMEIAGFALAVWAFGTLLRCRPPVGCDGTVSQPSGLSDRQVVRLVLVFLVLSVHDLVCTLCAHAQGSLWEHNLLAAPLLAHVPGLVVFKLSLTFGAALVLLVARSCRLAQVTSWWTAIVYTILILRWTTYCSLFAAD